MYGAVLSGEHVFYVLDKGKRDRLDGRARFLHVWLVKDGVWRMSRVLSFDHDPVVIEPELKSHYRARAKGSPGARVFTA